MSKLRDAFECAVAGHDSYGLKRSRRGTYVNPAIARDWRWFQLGSEAPSTIRRQEGDAAEPVGEVFTMEALAYPRDGTRCHVSLYKPLPAGTKLYTTPPQTQAGEGQAEPVHEWRVIGPDGTCFTGETPFKAATLANRHRVQVDPVAAKQSADAIASFHREAAAENERLEAEYGSLNCPTCGGSGHIGDALARPTAAQAGEAEALARANRIIAANPYTEYAHVAQNAGVERERAERHARTLLVAAMQEPTA